LKNGQKKPKRSIDIPFSLSPSPFGEEFRVRCSTLLEDIATTKAKANGLDVADFMIEQLRKTTTDPVLEIQNHFSPTFQSMMEKNPVLSILMDKLQLEEIYTLLLYFTKIPKSEMNYVILWILNELVCIYSYKPIFFYCKSNSMNIAQITDNLEKLVESFNKVSFIFTFSLWNT